MKKTFAVLICLSFWLAGCAARTTERKAVVLPIDESVRLEIVLSDSRWEISRQAPPFLVDLIIDHLEEETAVSGTQLSKTQLRQLAQKRLAVNEAFVSNQATGAYLLIDFSRLPGGAAPPDRKDIFGSTYGAGLALENEKGVSGLSADIRSVRLAGSRLAYRTDIRYRLHGEPRRFIGIVGCTASHRFYFYYTDFLRDPLDAELMERMLRSLRIRTGDHL